MFPIRKLIRLSGYVSYRFRLNCGMSKVPPARVSHLIENGSGGLPLTECLQYLFRFDWTIPLRSSDSGFSSLLIWHWRIGIVYCVATHVSTVGFSVLDFYRFLRGLQSLDHSTKRNMIAAKFMTTPFGDQLQSIIKTARVDMFYTSTAYRHGFNHFHRQALPYTDNVI